MVDHYDIMRNYFGEINKKQALALERKTMNLQLDDGERKQAFAENFKLNILKNAVENVGIDSVGSGGFSSFLFFCRGVGGDFDAHDSPGW